ncbi:hypothetical protein [Streptomyces griseus]|uniref:hypothetical protein n=1 Tax=Streptomyces griseus TaxID=1911 RepID=UPI00365301A0
MVVQNVATVGIYIDGKIETNFGGDVGCYRSIINPGFTRGCYGPTIEGIGAGARGDGWLIMNYRYSEWYSEAIAR